MFYVVRRGDSISNYHASYKEEAAARNYAENLKATYGHNYNVIQVYTVWTTLTPDEAIKEMRG